jgi:[ribulose-bisphosphate carboxylase]-lysine N-methyltransferase
VKRKYYSKSMIFLRREQELDDLEYYKERRLKDLGFLCDNGEIIFWES